MNNAQHQVESRMSPEARRTLWNIYRRITERAPSEREPARFRIFSEAQAGSEGFPAAHLTELALEGYLSDSKVRFLTKKGQAGQLEHSTPSTRYRMLRRIIFDEFRSWRQQNPGAHTWSNYKAEDCAQLGVASQELELAQQELADVGVLKLFAMNEGVNSYTLTELGKQACVREYLVEELLSGRRRNTGPVDAGHVYHVQNHVSVGQGQVFQNTGPGSVNVDQGDIVFGAAVPVAREAELRRLLGELGAGFATEEVAPADREDAQDALAKIGAELGKPEPHKARLSRAAETVSQVAEPFDKLASIAAQTVAVLQAIGLLPSL